MNTQKCAIESKNIVVGYGDKVVLKELSLSIPLGKITTIIGPNGCGKSTFLKTIGRILTAQKGSIYLNGDDIHKIPTKELAKKMAILPQTPVAPDGITVEELVSYGRYPYQKGLGKLTKEDKDIVAWAIEATNLDEIKEKEVENLSGGQRQRVWIAMALAQQTDIILLDEPTTYLDMAYQLEVLELLDDLNKIHGCTIIMVLHDLNLAAKFADYMVALKSGSVISQGDIYTVMTKDVLRDVYQIEANVVLDTVDKKPVCLSYQLLGKKTLRERKSGAQ